MQLIIIIWMHIYPVIESYFIEGSINSYIEWEQWGRKESMTSFIIGQLRLKYGMSGYLSLIIIIIWNALYCIVWEPSEIILQSSSRFCWISQYYLWVHQWENGHGILPLHCLLLWPTCFLQLALWLLGRPILWSFM